MNELGIDFSRWQCPINWLKMVAAWPAFAAVRGGIGEIYVDSYFESNFTALKMYGIPTTAYFVMRPDVKAANQAAWFLKTYKIVQSAGLESDLPLVLDCEIEKDANGNQISGAVISQVIYDIAHAMQDKLGKSIIIYGRTEWFERLVKKRWTNDFDWWIALYRKVNGVIDETNTIPPSPPTYVDPARVKIHQYTDRLLDTAKYGVASKQLDGDRWVGPETLQEYIAAYTGVAPVPDVPDPVVIDLSQEDRITRLETAAVSHGWVL